MPFSKEEGLDIRKLFPQIFPDSDMHAKKLLSLTDGQCQRMLACGEMTEFDANFREFLLGRLRWPDITGEDVLRIRTVRCITQSDLATLVGVSRSNISRWECGKQRVPERHAAFLALIDRFGSDFFKVMNRHGDPCGGGSLRTDPACATTQPAACRASLASMRDRAAVSSGTLEPADITRIRVQAQLTRAELASALNVSSNAIDKWESGETRPAGPSRLLLRSIEMYGPDFIRLLEGAGE